MPVKNKFLHENCRYTITHRLPTYRVIVCLERLHISRRVGNLLLFSEDGYLQSYVSL